MTKACELLIMEIAVKACVTAGQGGKNVIEVRISKMVAKNRESDSDCNDLVGLYALS